MGQIGATALNEQPRWAQDRYAQRVWVQPALALRPTTSTSGAVTAVTDDASIDQYDGILDWVYQEEVYGRGDFKGFWWNPTGTHLAYVAIDQTAVPTKAMCFSVRFDSQIQKGMEAKPATKKAMRITGA